MENEKILTESDGEDLAARQAYLERRETLLEKRERLAEALALPKDQQKIIDEAIKVYKIPKEYIFSTGFNDRTGEAHVLTYGGFKVKHKKGAPAKCELTPVQITGKATQEETAWYEKLNQRIPLKFFKSKA